MTDARIVSIYFTFPDEAAATDTMSRLLAEERIACANVFPAVRSLYRWQGEVKDEPEVVVFAKASASRLDELVERARELHPYDTPCIVALPVVSGDPGYLAWVEQECDRS